MQFGAIHRAIPGGAEEPEGQQEPQWGGAEAAAAGGDGAEGQAGHGQAAPGDAAAAQREANRAQRGEALAWLQGGPLADVVLLKICVAPLAWLQERQLLMSSGAWHSEQWG